MWTLKGTVKGVEYSIVKGVEYSIVKGIGSTESTHMWEYQNLNTPVMKAILVPLCLASILAASSFSTPYPSSLTFVSWSLPLSALQRQAPGRPKAPERPRASERPKPSKPAVGPNRCVHVLVTLIPIFIRHNALLILPNL